MLTNSGTFWSPVNQWVYKLFRFVNANVWYSTTCHERNPDRHSYSMIKGTRRHELRTGTENYFKMSAISGTRLLDLATSSTVIVSRGLRLTRVFSSSGNWYEATHVTCRTMQRVTICLVRTFFTNNKCYILVEEWRTRFVRTWTVKVTYIEESMSRMLAIFALQNPSFHCCASIYLDTSPWPSPSRGINWLPPGAISWEE